MQPFQRSSFQGRLRCALLAAVAFKSKQTKREKESVLLAYCSFCTEAEA